MKFPKIRTSTLIFCALVYLLFLSYAVYRIEYLVAKPCDLCKGQGYTVTEPVKIYQGPYVDFSGLNLSGIEVSDPGSGGS